MKNDLYWEHEQHTSDDWANLKDECSECYASLIRMRKSIPERDVYERNQEALGRLDEHFIPNYVKD